jgi:DNA-binding NtrC family response regulator
MVNRRRDTDESRPARILVVDDDPLIALLVQSALSDIRFELQSAETGADARRHFERKRPDLVLLDQMLPDAQGLDLLQQFLAIDTRMPVLFITAQDGSDTAIEAMKRGAFDYLTKPLDLNVLKRQIDLALEARRLTSIPVVIANPNSSDQVEADSLVGRCPAMAEVYKSIGRAASRDLPVLLTGEPGTGKALVARAIYQHSSRASMPLRSIKCSEYSPSALEVELFGGVSSRGEQVGLFRQIDGGTLFLEEIAACGAATQGKLLQLLTTHKLEIDGELKKIDFRIIASSSADLESAVARGEFRADLYYAIRPIRIHLPPLREREGDLPALVDYHVKRFSRLSASLNQPTVRVSSDALELLCEYDWPGNLDELQSVLRQALVENTGTILASNSLRTALGVREHGASRRTTASSRDKDSEGTDWPAWVAARLQTGTSDLYADAIAEMERQVIPRVLEETKGNQLRAAAILGMTRGSLRKKLRAMGLIAASSIDTGPNGSVSSDSVEQAESEEASHGT